MTTNYVVVESLNLLQRRFGLALASRLVEHVSANLSVLWMDEARQEEVVRLWRREGRRDLSFVDCSSFAIMREQGIDTALTFDEDFRKAGFRVIDSPPMPEVHEPRARYRTSCRKSS